LRKMLASDDSGIKADLLYTGLIVNLLNLRPEICTLLIIRNEEWFEEESEFLEYNYEFLDAKEEPQIPRDVRHGRQLVPSIKLDGNLDIVPEDKGLLCPENMVPPATGAIDLGLRVAKKVLLKK